MTCAPLAGTQSAGALEFPGVSASTGHAATRQRIPESSCGLHHDGRVFRRSGPDDSQAQAPREGLDCARIQRNMVDPGPEQVRQHRGRLTQTGLCHLREEERQGLSLSQRQTVVR